MQACILKPVPNSIFSQTSVVGFWGLRAQTPNMGFALEPTGRTGSKPTFLHSHFK